jgi:hypothetical protein
MVATYVFARVIETSMVAKRLLPESLRLPRMPRMYLPESLRLLRLPESLRLLRLPESLRHPWLPESLRHPWLPESLRHPWLPRNNVIAARWRSQRRSRTILHRRPTSNLRTKQGDQIGRIFAYWAIVFFGQFI